MARKFAWDEAFKHSLEANLRKFAVDHDTPYQTLRTKFAIERLLARLFRVETAPWLLKGGFAMDLRFRPKARTTKDVDLSVTPAPKADQAAVELREQMQDALDVDLGDYIQFRIGEPSDIASAIEWLLSPEQSWITGQVFGVDGGLASVRSR